MAIEQSSWENTWRLIPEEEREEIFSGTPSPEEADASKEVSETTLDRKEKAFLAFLLDGNQEEARRFARDNSCSYIALGEAINEFFADMIGDIVLELLGDDYTVIPDYEDEIRAAITA